MVNQVPKRLRTVVCQAVENLRIITVQYNKIIHISALIFLGFIRNICNKSIVYKVLFTDKTSNYFHLSSGNRY